MSELITIKQSDKYPELSIKKYHRKVFFDNLWHTDPELMESRGHVINKEGKIVVNPLTKIFNRGENNTDIDRDEHCLAVEKINGFMAAVTYIPEVDDVVISTTGSLDSDYVQYAKDMLPEAVFKFLRNSKYIATFIFEIVHPDDPHIIKEQEGAYLIAFRDISSTTPYFTNRIQEKMLDLMAKQMKVLRPIWADNCRFSDIVDSVKDRKTEGYIVYGQSSHTVLKLKSPYYLSLKAMARKKDILSLDKKRVDEEYYSLLDHLIGMGNLFNELNEQDRLICINEFLNKKE